MIEFNLPFPPSTNSLFAGKARRYTSKPYARWKKQAGLAVMAQRQKQPIAPDIVHITIELTPPDRRRRDADNLCKPILDCLVSMMILRGDDQRFVRGVTACWATDPGSPGARVRITPA